jgi:hypothetical protein
MGPCHHPDHHDYWQYRIFKAVLFIIFLASTYKLLDHELHVTQFVYSILGY